VITGLTVRQVELLDTMWELDTIEEIREWQSTLDVHDLFDSEGLIILLGLAVLDCRVDQLTNYKLAQKALSKFYAKRTPPN
jgi:hypothetical protein